MQKQRCLWCGTDPLMVAYHDHEWGRPNHDDRKLFEAVLLDGFSGRVKLEYHPAET